MTATPAKLTTFEIESLLTQLPGWTVVAGKLHREYRFPNFGKAFGFMKTAAPAIEKMDHQPCGKAFLVGSGAHLELSDVRSNS